MSSSWNFGSGQYLSSSAFSPARVKKRMKRYSLKMGPMVPGGGHGIFSISRGMIGFPVMDTDKFTWNMRGIHQFNLKLTTWYICSQ